MALFREMIQNALSSTATPSPTPAVARFADSPVDSFNPNDSAAYSDLQAGILGIEILRSQDGYEIRVLKARSFLTENYIYALVINLKDAEGNTRAFRYEIHNGKPSIGEVDSSDNLVPNSSAVVVYNPDARQLAIQFPSPFLEGLTPPPTISEESYPKSTPSSV